MYCGHALLCRLTQFQDVNHPTGLLKQLDNTVNGASEV